MRDSKDDIFEEFEFKPLTEGLGFHKKAINLKTEVESTGLVSHRADHNVIPSTPDDLFDEPSEVASSFADLSPRQETRASRFEATAKSEKVPSIDELGRQPSIHQPLAREKKVETTSATDRISPMLKLDFAETAAAKSSEITKDVLRDTALQPKFAEISSNMTSAVFDSVVAFTFSILFLVAMISVTNIDIVALVFNAKTQLVVQGSLVLMYLAILQIYMIVSRVIGGATLGEWAFDVHLAEKGDRRSGLFIFKVIIRCLVSTLTGFVVLPFLSLVFRKDLAGRISGTRLFQQQ